MAKPPRVLPVIGSAPEVRPPPPPPTTPPARASSSPPRVVRLIIGRTASGTRRLLAASLWSLVGCADSHGPHRPAASSDAALPTLDSGLFGPPDGQTPRDGEASADATSLSDAGSSRVDPRYPFDVRDDAGRARCGGGEVVFAQLPPEGVPADLHQVCARPATELVQSGWAARLVLTPDPSAVNGARGFIELAPELAGRVVGVPKLQVSAPDFQGFQLSLPSLGASGQFEVSARWDGPAVSLGESYRRVHAKIGLEVRCSEDGGELMRSVEAQNELYVCNEGSGKTSWISSGETCTTCAIIAEMAPSPIVPMPRASELPLSSVLRLNLRMIAAAGNDLLVYAEHDGGADDAAYSWHPSAGEIEPLADDVVLWRLPPDCSGPQLLQVVVDANSAVAVASLRFSGGLS